MFPKVPLSSVLRKAEESVVIEPEKTYKQVTVRLFHRGVVLRGQQAGADIRTPRQWRVRAGQILLSRIDARNGAIGIVPADLDGTIVTNDFWAFEPGGGVAEPRFLDAYFGTPEFVEACKRASEGTTNRVRLQLERFLDIEVALPPLPEQRRIVARIGELAAKIDEARRLQNEIDSGLRGVLLGEYREITEGAPLLPMVEAAPLKRRPVEVEPGEKYYETGIRSFGNGTFHKPPIEGTSVGTKKLFRIEANDLLFNIVFAWEGAVAVASPRDHGRVGSHRFLACVPKEGLATSTFLCFHFLTEQGLEQLGKASPGGAGRNRTLGLKSLEEIQVPLPVYEEQLWFDSLLAKIDSLRALRTQAAAELEALLPSILDKAFKGEL